MSTKKKEKTWIPLEANIELLNKYMYNMGVEKRMEFHDIYGTDEGLLSMVPRPIYAVMMLFPISKASEKHKQEENNQYKDDDTYQQFGKNVYHMKQTIGNACGTVGLTHAILNNVNSIKLDENKFFGKFWKHTKNMTPEERGAALEENDDIEVAHEEVATEATSNANHSANDNLHFNAFVIVDGYLFELDGRKNFPVCHGESSGDLLADAVGVVKQFMARDPDDIRFNLVALGETQG